MEVITMGRSARPLKSFPVHHHGYWEIMVNLTGSGDLIADDARYPFQENDIFLIPPDTPHTKISRCGFEDMCMFVKDMRTIGSPGVRRITDDDRQTVTQLMCAAYRAFSAPAESAPHNTAAILNALGEAIYQVLVGLYATGHHRDLRIDGFIECLEANITNPDFDLSAEVDKTGYCRGYFRKVFKDAVGETPVAYFNHIRIEYARREFEHYGNSRSIKDVALACGFHDPYYFSRVFKKITSVSPAAYLSQLGEFNETEIEHLDSQNTEDKQLRPAKNTVKRHLSPHPAPELSGSRTAVKGGTQE